MNSWLKKGFGRKRIVVLAGTAALLLSLSVTAQAGDESTAYEIRLVDSPLPPDPAFPGTPWTWLNDINDRGLATFVSETGQPGNFFIGVQAGGIYDTHTGEFVNLWEGEFDYSTGQYLSFTGVNAFGINNRGELATAGCSYVDKRGDEIQLNHPQGWVCDTRGISSSGIISGMTVDLVSGTWRGFVYNQKTETFDDFLPSPWRNIAQGINAQGQVAGSYGTDSGDLVGYVRNLAGATRFFTVEIDGASYPTQARGIASDGTIAGVFEDDFGRQNGFVGHLPEDPYAETLIPDTVFSPDDITECSYGIFLTRINNSGVITGLCYAYAHAGTRGLLLTPVSDED